MVIASLETYMLVLSSRLLPSYMLYEHLLLLVYFGYIWYRKLFIFYATFETPPAFSNCYNGARWSESITNGAILSKNSCSRAFGRDNKCEGLSLYSTDRSWMVVGPYTPVSKE